MNGISARVALLAAAFAPAAWAALPLNHDALPAYRPGELLVKYRGGRDAPAAGALRAAYALSPRATLLRGRMELVGLPSVLDVRGALAALRREPAVEYVEPNFVSHKRAVQPNDPLFGMQWGEQNTGQPNFFSGGPAGTPGGDLNLVNAWDLDGNGVADHGGTGAVTIAIVDDAVETTHPDLAANVVAGFNFVDGNSNPNPAKASESHGTAVAGCAAAVGNNGIGVAGAAWNEKLMPLKFNFDVAGEVAALQYARDNGARIVNASFGSPAYTRAEHDAIADLAAHDVLFVTSAGNENANTDLAGAEYPANYQLGNVVAVAATNRQDEVASFSSYGSVTVPVAAPGLQIVTTAVNASYTTPNGDVTGTSFASPYAAGIAALIRDYIPAASAAEVKARLIESARPGLDPANPVDLRSAGGRIDAAQALRLAPRPSLVIQPVQTGSYQVDYGSAGTETVPIFWPVAGADGRVPLLTPGQSTDLRITLANLWQNATAVQATLSASDGVIVNSGTVAYGDIAAQGSATQSFNISVPASLTGHRYLSFTLAISANGGAYTASRHFIQDLGVLQAGVAQTQTIQTDLYDEFQTWRFDVGVLPPGTDQISFATQAANDIDLLVSYGAPAQYDIELGSTASDRVYFANIPDAQIGGAQGGDERVTIRNPASGAYYLTVVNYDQADNASYQLSASYSKSSSGSGGALPPLALLPLALAALARALRTRRR